MEEPVLRRSTRLRNTSKVEDALDKWHYEEAKRKGCLDAMEEEIHQIEEATSHLAKVNYAHHLACAATKDIPWSKLLKQYPEAAPIAIQKELDALEKNILQLIDGHHPDRKEAVENACPGRIIGTVRRDEEVKARGVKQGFRENLEEADIQWSFDKLGGRFDCKDAEWLTKGNPLDFLGMNISMDDENIYLSMENYVDKMLGVMQMEDIGTKPTPIDKEIEDTTPLGKELLKPFMTGVGCVGWLVNTVRLDASLAHSRIAQHMASPTVGAWKALVHLMKYFKGTRKACIHQPLDGGVEDEWRFFCDSSDFAGNPSEENKRRSQNGFVATV